MNLKEYTFETDRLNLRVRRVYEVRKLFFLLQINVCDSGFVEENSYSSFSAK